MDRLSVLSANFESTVNDILGHANFRKMAIFKFITVIPDTVKIMHIHVKITGENLNSSFKIRNCNAFSIP